METINHEPHRKEGQHGCIVCGSQRVQFDAGLADDSPSLPVRIVCCDTCGTRFQYAYKLDTIQREEVVWPVHARLVNVTLQQDDDDGEIRCTPPGFIWTVHQILGDTRGIGCQKTGSSLLPDLDDLTAQFLPLGDLRLLHFEHDGYEVKVPTRECGSFWNECDPREEYGFRFICQDAGNKGWLHRDLPGQAGCITIGPYYLNVPGRSNLEDSASVVRHNAIGEILARATLAEMLAAVEREAEVDHAEQQRASDRRMDRGHFELYYEDAGEHPVHTRFEWRQAVASDSTVSGYWDWAYHQATR